MKTIDVYNKIGKIIEKHGGESELVFDTEARKFGCHFVSIGGVWFINGDLIDDEDKVVMTTDQ